MCLIYLISLSLFFLLRYLFFSFSPSLSSFFEKFIFFSPIYTSLILPTKASIVLHTARQHWEIFEMAPKAL